ncbi:hypothetical protein GOBAR_AA15201 [Gossypium barbadense]|uniref:Uncharacterized protein n=1 Tax=Gossypium barbadense TaxID=3634 RepID=A0A2P5XQ50_GOSBA|nr:hypothetical protein GOBAR_AA15201 [Gossypium barbadense]
MAEDINVLLERLNFSEEESRRVTSTNMKSTNPQSYVPHPQVLMVYQGRGEVLAIDWRDRDGGWTDYIRLRIKIDVFKPLRRMVHLVGSDGIKTVCTIKYERFPRLIGHTTQKCSRKEEHNETGNSSFQYGSWLKVQLGGTTQMGGNRRNVIEIQESNANHNVEIIEAKEWNGDDNDLARLKEKEKKNQSWERGIRVLVIGGNGENNEESPAQLVKRRLADILSPCKAVAGDQPRQEMDGCLTVNSDGRSGGLAMLWMKGIDVAIQNYYSHHIDSLVREMLNFVSGSVTMFSKLRKY